MKRIQSKLHRIGNYDFFTTSLSCFDDKRYILGDCINSLAYFHKDVKIQWKMWAQNGIFNFMYPEHIEIKTWYMIT